MCAIWLQGADLNGEGRLQHSEFITCIQHLLLNESELHGEYKVRHPKVLKKVAKAVDLNNNGVLLRKAMPRNS